MIENPAGHDVALGYRPKEWSRRPSFGPMQGQCGREPRIIESVGIQMPVFGRVQMPYDQVSSIELVNSRRTDRNTEFLVKGIFLGNS